MNSILTGLHLLSASNTRCSCPHQGDWLT